MSIGRHTPPLIENLFLLAHERKVHIHIGVAVRDIAEPRPTVTCQITPANERDKRVEHFSMAIEPLNPRMSQALWYSILDYVDRVAPKKVNLRIIAGNE